MRQVTFQNRTFNEVGTVPYTNKKGEAITLIVFESACIDCGTAFHIRVSENAIAGSKAFWRKRCDAHKTSRSEFMEKLIAGSKARRKLTDEDVADIRRYAKQGFKPADLALVYPVSENTLYAIIKGLRR